MIDREGTNIGVHALLITNQNQVILQQRDKKFGLINSGLISMYGGTIKKGEKLLEGLQRELEEELDLDISKLHPKKLGEYIKTKDVDGIDYLIHVWRIDGVSVNLNSKEGGVVVFEPRHALENTKLTRITRKAIEDFLSS